MQEFTYHRADTVPAALSASGRFLAGGTTLIDLMKLDVETPKSVVDIHRLPLDKIEILPDGGLRIGATVRNSDLAQHLEVKSRYAVLSQAILSGASAQIRNKATTAGNLLQRTRCSYFRDTAWSCNKRVPGSGCPAIAGANRTLAILGASESCIATNPSDMNVALTALDAVVVTNARRIPIRELFLVPGSTPERETVLQSGELITHVELPPLASGTRSVYLKLRDRASYEFALASAAVVGTMSAGVLTQVRIALGGVGTVPWRSPEAEAVLNGKPVSVEAFHAAAQAALAGARPQSQNGFKVELARRCLKHALALATKAEA